MGEKNAVIYSTATATLPFVGMRWYHKWKKEGIYEFPIIFSSLAIRGGFVHKGKKPLDVFI